MKAGWARTAMLRLSVDAAQALRRMIVAGTCLNMFRCGWGCACIRPGYVTVFTGVGVQRMRRINEIHRRLCEGRIWTAVALARDFEVDERTIRRDLEYMRDQLRMPLEYERHRRTWYYSEPAGDLSATLVSIKDRVALLVAQQAVEQFAGTPWYEQLKNAMARIIEALPQETVTEFQRVAERIRFEGSPLPPLSSAVWNEICDCIELSETIQIDYKTGHSGEQREREVDPYGLVVRNREWFLIAWDHYRNGVRTFFLPRIKSAESTDRAFKVKDGFDLDEYLATSVDSHQSTGPIYDVKLRFTAEATPAGEDFIWNRNEKKYKDKQGRLVLEFRTGALYAVQRHVLSWGGGVEVMGPEELRKSVEAAARAISAAHARAKDIDLTP